MPVVASFPKPFVALASFAITLWLLSWLEPVLVPVALAILFTFLLRPLVTLLQHRHLPRVPAVIVVVAVTFSSLGGVGWLIAREVTELVDAYPQYEQNLNAKLDALQGSQGGFIDKLQYVEERISRRIAEHKQAPATGATPDASSAPLPVTVIADNNPFQLSRLWSVLGPAIEPFAAVGLTIVLLIFMLIRREDLRDRAISLVGRGHLSLTTKALDEAGERIGRYLLTQVGINGSYGAAIAAGLFVIGIPYAVLWGFLAFVLRYIPYLGAWLAAILPLGLSLLVSQTWTSPMLVLGWFLVLEIVTNMVIEPMLYGRGIGVSETATLVMVAFWTWLWGPVGLLLATPLTVCLVVLGKYVPAIGFFDVLLGDKPAIEAPVGYYQRLLARDQDEASEIAQEEFTSTSLAQTFDSLLVPALVRAKRDAERETLEADDQRFVIDATRDTTEDLVILHEKALSAAPGVDAPVAVAGAAVRVFCCPARDASDETALFMLRHLLDTGAYAVTVGATRLLASEVLALVDETKPDAVCIAALPPGGVAQARLLCMRLRAQFPQLKILIGRWGERADMAKAAAQFIAAGASEVAVTLEETLAQLATLRTLSSANAGLDVSVNGGPGVPRSPEPASHLHDHIV